MKNSVDDFVEKLKEIVAWQPTYEQSAGALIYRREGKNIRFLFLIYPHGHMDIAKGHIEDGETEEEAARREIMEETGITDIIIQPGFKEDVQYSYMARGDEKEERITQKKGLLIFKKVTIYLAETSEKEVNISHEHTEHVWLTYKQAMKRVTYANPREILKKAKKYLERKSF